MSGRREFNVRSSFDLMATLSCESVQYNLVAWASRKAHCSFNRVIRPRTFVPGAIFADFSMARQAGLRVTGYGSTNATSRIACSLLEPSHTRTASPSGEVFSRRFLAPAMRLMSQRRGKPFRFMTCKETMSWLVVIRT